MSYIYIYISISISELGLSRPRCHSTLSTLTGMTLRCGTSSAGFCPAALRWRKEAAESSTAGRALRAGRRWPQQELQHVLNIYTVLRVCIYIIIYIIIYIYIYNIYILIDLKVLVRSFNCENRACYVGNPREVFFFFRVRENNIFFVKVSRKLDIMIAEHRFRER